MVVVVLLLLVVVEVMVVVVVVVVVVVIVARREKEEEKEVEVEETAVAEMEEEEEATVLRKADTRGGWEQCRSMPAASQPADPTLPSLLLFSSLTLYPVFPPRLRRTHPEIKHERLHGPPLHTLPTARVALPFSLLSFCLSPALPFSRSLCRPLPPPGPSPLSARRFCLVATLSIYLSLFRSSLSSLAYV